MDRTKKETAVYDLWHLKSNLRKKMLLSKACFAASATAICIIFSVSVWAGAVACLGRLASFYYCLLFFSKTNIITIGVSSGFGDGEP